MFSPRISATSAVILLQTIPVAGKTYLFRVPYYGFYIYVLKKVGFGRPRY